MPTFSIIIPLKELNEYVRETVPYIFGLDYSDWELFIVTNDEQASEWPEEPRIKMISSGRVGPAEKRDLAARVAAGTYLVFLDDDSYPESNLLSLALTKFTAGSVALGGPAMTPRSDSFKQKVSGVVFSSRITGGVVPASQWVHIALSRSGTSTRLFMDGLQTGSTYTDTLNYIASPVRIGDGNDGVSPTASFSGYIDDFRITKGIARYTANFTPPTLPFPDF